MDASTFKSKMAGLGLSQSLAAVLMKVPLGTLKSWLNRGEVPDDVAAKLVAQPDAESLKPVAGTVATVAAVAPAMARLPDDLPGDLPTQVVIPTGEVGHPEFDIMADGWARGFPSDEGHLRTYRTAHAIRRFAEKRGEESRAKTLTTEFWAKYAGAAESRVAFFKKLAGAK